MTAVQLRSESGRVVRAPQWVRSVGAAEQALLGRAVSPVLDVGCGPGRHVVELHRLGLATLGIDISLPALALARRRGALVLHRSIFDEVPAPRRWATALLLDGNVGIGGCPRTLLARVARILRPDGRVLVETRPPGAHRLVERVRIEVDGLAGPWFEFGQVGIDDVASVAAEAGLVVVDRWTSEGRWFAELRRAPGR